MNSLDLPPNWLLGFIVVAWLISYFAPGMTLQLPWQGIVALVLLAIGLILTGLAVFEMTRAKTAAIPRRNASALVTTGIFRLSRNPIYLGDAFMLASAVIWFQAGPGLLLIPVFVWLIRRRFIDGEESGLCKEFGEDFERWQKKTRRWL
jgi:protein-S-isoprenylcysteine O-methyltransferase Ste14